MRMCLWSCQLDVANLSYFNLCRKFARIYMIVDSPKAAIVVVICRPLNALIDSHILGLKKKPKTVNTEISCFE